MQFAWQILNQILRTACRRSSKYPSEAETDAIELTALSRSALSPIAPLQISKKTDPKVAFLILGTNSIIVVGLSARLANDLISVYDLGANGFHLPLNQEQPYLTQLVAGTLGIAATEALCGFIVIGNDAWKGTHRLLTLSNPTILFFDTLTAATTFASLAFSFINNNTLNPSQTQIDTFSDPAFWISLAIGLVFATTQMIAGYGQKLNFSPGGHLPTEFFSVPIEEKISLPKRFLNGVFRTIHIVGPAINMANSLSYLLFDWDPDQFYNTQTQIYNGYAIGGGVALAQTLSFLNLMRLMWRPTKSQGFIGFLWDQSQILFDHLLYDLSATALTASSVFFMFALGVMNFCNLSYNDFLDTYGITALTLAITIATFGALPAAHLQYQEDIKERFITKQQKRALDLPAQLMRPENAGKQALARYLSTPQSTSRYNFFKAFSGNLKGDGIPKANKREKQHDASLGRKRHSFHR